MDDHNTESGIILASREVIESLVADIVAANKDKACVARDILWAVSPFISGGSSSTQNNAFSDRADSPLTMLCQRYWENKTDLGKTFPDFPKKLEQISQHNPDAALTIALLIGPFVKEDVYETVVSHACDISDSNVGLLRETAAYLMVRVIKLYRTEYVGAGNVTPGDIQLRQSLEQMLTKLSRTEGQQGQVRSLVDNFMTEDLIEGESELAFFEPLLRFGTAAKVTDIRAEIYAPTSRL